MQAARPHAANQVFLKRLLGFGRHRRQPKDEIGGNDSSRAQLIFTVMLYFKEKVRHDRSAGGLRRRCPRLRRWNWWR